MRQGGVVLAIAAVCALQGGEGAPAPDRPKIGLVLSGGGARGCAHLGVLRALEEMRVPIDYIAGTSMGAVIGGVYASGVSAEDYTYLLTQIDWEDALEDKPSRTDLAFRRKQEDSRYLLDLELGLSLKGILAPSGLRAGQKLALLLRNLTLPYGEAADFDDLPIPFRAVATDIERGTMVVLGRGDLARSIRASMAIPGMFTAVEIDGRLLSDGGLTRNLPVDVARAMGADVVIAVDITEPLRERERLGTLFGISDQIVGFISRLNVESSLDQADLALTPDVEGVGMLNFTDVAGIAARGEAEARRHAHELARYAVSEEAYRRYRERFRDPRIPSKSVAYIIFEGLEHVDERPLRRRLRHGVGEPLDVAKLMRDINRIYGLGDFEQIDYRIEPEQDGRVGVILQCREKSWGPNYLHFGLNLSVDDSQDTTFDGLINLTSVPLNAKRGEWRTDLQLGRTLGLNTELFQPLDWQGRFFAAVVAGWRRERIDVYRGRQEVAEVEATNALYGVDVGVQLGSFGEIRAGLRHGKVSSNLEVGDPDSPVFTPAELALVQEGSDLGGALLSLSVDRLDDVAFPKRGGSLTVQAWLSRPGLGSDLDYDRLELNSFGALSRGRHTFFLNIDGGTDLDTGLPPYSEFSLGGFLSFSGYRRFELSGANYGKLNLGYYSRLGKQSLMKKLYLGGWVEAGNVWARTSEASLNDLRYAGTFLFGMDTILGPIYIAWGKAEQGRDTLYLTAGSRF